MTEVKKTKLYKLGRENDASWEERMIQVKRRECYEIGREKIEVKKTEY